MPRDPSPSILLLPCQQSLSLYLRQARVSCEVTHSIRIQFIPQELTASSMMASPKNNDGIFQGGFPSSVPAGHISFLGCLSWCCQSFPLSAVRDEPHGSPGPPIQRLIEHVTSEGEETTLVLSASNSGSSGWPGALSNIKITSKGSPSKATYFQTSGTKN